jgi:hypothetical protein
MERIEVNCETGEVRTIQLTTEEVVAAEAQYAVWQAEQSQATAPVDLQAQILALTAELDAIKSKVGA